MLALSSAAARDAPIDEHGIPGLMADSGSVLSGMSPVGALAIEFVGLEPRDLGRRACGDSLSLDPCSADPSVCCPVGGQCCFSAWGPPQCCPAGTECQSITIKGSIICCLKGMDCTNFDDPPVNTTLSGIVVNIDLHVLFSP